MSLEAVRWVRMHTINDRYVESILLAIAFRADDNGCCVSSLKQISRRVGLSVADVREKLRWLRGLRMIWTIRASDGYVFFLPINPKFHDQRGRVL